MADANIVLRTARTQIEDGLISYILLALGFRYPPMADVTALRARSSSGLLDDALLFVTAKGFTYRWRPFETTADDGDQFIQPADVTAAGRWIKTTSTVQTGYLRRVRLFDDSARDSETMLERLLGVTPSVMVSFQSAKHDPRSLQPGALYWYTADFTLLAVSENLRGGAQETGRRGSLVSSEAAVDPGTAAIMGDLKATLAGTNLGIVDVARCELGDERAVYIELATRRATEELDVTVTATLTNPDAPSLLTQLGSPWTFSVQEELATTPDGANYDPSNAIVLKSPAGDWYTTQLAARDVAGVFPMGASNANVGTGPLEIVSFGEERGLPQLYPQAQPGSAWRLIGGANVELSRTDAQPFQPTVFGWKYWFRPLAFGTDASGYNAVGFGSMRPGTNNLGQLIFVVGSFTQITGPTLTLGAIYQVAVTYDGTTFRLYLDSGSGMTLIGSSPVALDYSHPNFSLNTSTANMDVGGFSFDFATDALATMQLDTLASKQAPFRVPSGPLAATIIGGAAVVGGTAVQVPHTPKTFGDARLTWRDLLSNGSYVFVESLVTDPQPPVTAGALRIGVTLTEGGFVTGDRLLCSAIEALGPVNRIEQPLVTALTIAPINPSVGHGSQLQFTATATYESGETVDVTPLVTWSSDTPSVATIAATGVATCISAGDTTISAALGGQSAFTFLAVT